MLSKSIVPLSTIGYGGQIFVTGENRTADASCDVDVVVVVGIVL